MPGGAIRGMYQLRVDEVTVEEGEITVRAFIQPPNAENPIAVVVWPSAVDINGLGITLTKNGEVEPITVEIIDLDSFMVTAPPLSGEYVLYVPPALPEFDTSNKLTCMGMMQVLDLCPVDILKWNVNLEDLTDPEEPVFETVLVEGDLFRGYYEGSSPNYGIVILEWALVEAEQQWVIRLPDLPPPGTIYLIGENPDSERCRPEADNYLNGSTTDYRADVSAVE